MCCLNEGSEWQTRNSSVRGATVMDEDSWESVKEGGIFLYLRQQSLGRRLPVPLHFDVPEQQEALVLSKSNATTTGMGRIQRRGSCPGSKQHSMWEENLLYARTLEKLFSVSAHKAAISPFSLQIIYKLSTGSIRRMILPVGLRGIESTKTTPPVSRL